MSNKPTRCKNIRLLSGLCNLFDFIVARLSMVLAYIRKRLLCCDHRISCTSTDSLELKQIPVFQKRSNTYYLSGKLSFETVPLLWQQSQNILKDLGQASLIFDLKEVTHSDSSGVALLIAWTRNFRRRSQIIQFVHLPHQMLAIIQLAGLETIMPIKI
jgi:phospholipid transport system transporter-binding protein